jgi:glycosyltransferase involved in cell wall biosynthesis
VRVLIVHNRYRYPGGEERHIDLLEQGLTAAGVTVRRHERASSELVGSFRERVRLAGGLVYRPAARRELHRILAAWPADIVHFHNILPWFTPAALHAARRAGAGVVLTAHNYRFACPAGTLLRGSRVHEDCIEGSSLWCGLRNSRDSRVESAAYGVALEVHRRLRFLSSWVDAVVTPSDFLRRMLARFGFPSERIHTVAYGVPIEPPATYRPEHVLYAGRLSAEKGVATLIAAAERNRDIPLVVAGDGPLADYVRGHSGGAVKYVGHLDSDGVATLRNRAAFTVVPSEWYEVLPFAAIESIAAGRPAVATRVGGLPEIVSDGENGYLVPPGDPRFLAETMRRLWSDHALGERLGTNGWRTANERFSLRCQTSTLIDLYASIRERGRAT